MGKSPAAVAGIIAGAIVLSAGHQKPEPATDKTWLRVGKARRRLIDAGKGKASR
jgi:hypothetical protein